MIKLTYILAASHSGSTLLAMMLNGHPQVCSAGELKFTHLGDLDRYRCSCGDLIRRCTFWQRVGDAMAARGSHLDLLESGMSYRTACGAYARGLLRPLHRGALLEWVRDATLSLSPAWRVARPQVDRRNAALMQSILDISGARILVDSSKIAVRLKYHLRNPDLDVRVIRLIRDGRGVALTYMDPARFADASDPRLREGGCGGERADERQTMKCAARQWRRSNEEAENVLRCVPRSRWMELRYEDLCADPHGTMDHVLAFLEVSPGQWDPQFRAAGHHVIGNGMRLDDTSEVRLDERWRAVLGRGQLGVFDATAGEMIRRYGYA